MSNQSGTAKDAASPKGGTWSYVRRGAIGLLIGGIAGALIGALLVIFIVGWGDYAQSLSDNRPAGIVGANGTEAGFTRLVTFVFAFWGAVLCGPLGLLAGLLAGFRKPAGRRARHDPIRGVESGSNGRRI